MFRTMTLRALVLAGVAFGAPAIGRAQPAEPPAAANPNVVVAPPTTAEDPHAADSAAPPVEVHGEGAALHVEGAAMEGAHGAATHGEGHHGHADPSLHFNYFDIGYKKKDIAGGKLGDGKLGEQPLPPGESEEPMSAPFVLMLVNFGILLALLAKFGGPTARSMAEARHDQIRRALDEAAKLRNAASDKLAEYSSKLASAQAEMDAMLAGMRADAEAERKRILADAEAQAAAVKRDAELRIAAEIQRARAELTREVALAASGAAEKLLRERATVADHAALNDRFVAGVATQQGAV